MKPNPDPLLWQWRRCPTQGIKRFPGTHQPLPHTVLQMVPGTCTPAIQPMPTHLPEGYMSVRAPQETSQEGLTRSPSQRWEGLREVNKGCRQPGLARRGLSQTQVGEGDGGESPQKGAGSVSAGERKNTATTPPVGRGLERKWPVSA